MGTTLRDRVLKALAHEPPDVTPWQIDLTIDARQSTAEYLDDPGFEAKIGNHLAGCEDGFFIEVRPDYWRDNFGVVWNRTIDKDIGNPEEWLLKEPSLAGHRFPEPSYERNGRAVERLLARHADAFRYAGIGFSMFERAWTLRGMAELLTDMIDSTDSALHRDWLIDLLGFCGEPGGRQAS